VGDHFAAFLQPGLASCMPRMPVPLHFFFEVPRLMKLSDPLNIMMECCIPDKKRLLDAISRLAPGDVIQVEIDNCVSSKAMVETYLKNKWCRVVKVEDFPESSIMHIRLEVEAD
jgi:TusA-related sulfurtransferase